MAEIESPLFTPLSDSEVEVDAAKRILPYTESSRMITEYRDYYSAKMHAGDKVIMLLIYRLATVAEVIYHLQSKYNFNKRDSLILWYGENLPRINAVFEELVGQDETPEWMEFLVHTQPFAG